MWYVIRIKKYNNVHVLEYRIADTQKLDDSNGLIGLLMQVVNNVERFEVFAKQLSLDEWKNLYMQAFSDGVSGLVRQMLGEFLGLINNPSALYEGIWRQAKTQADQIAFLHEIESDRAVVDALNVL